ncbi:Putative antitoxin of toxin-antitoxin system, YdaS/YdaT [Nitrosospira multiformis]|uniref:Putative antitoxin of toxin-antitoxin system, YdaS/YdaT n=1 Tax=Nitrosospira multiformis TaxID=1231 RepID=A0A1H8IWJ2_9PROT|nr:YdaS family helix-turn-helix protein [Nitrosospira multiformis]SEN72068.1 Putative antitoxin of toxin-antitoxin system, YdaS/YdaT [Nitrosospira multiformis]
MKLKDYVKHKRGNATYLAERLDVSLSYLSQLSSGGASVSPERCVLIEEATSGKVTRKDLRPNDWHLIWPELRPKPKPRSVA